MACNCKHNQQEIKDGKAVIEELRELFIKRMTVDSEHNDRRRKDYNQAIFHWWEEDEAEADPHKTFQCWSEMDMGMVLECFDNAVKDWRRTFCDVESCNRK
jgi:hypothetical protein